MYSYVYFTVCGKKAFIFKILLAFENILHTRFPQFGDPRSLESRTCDFILVGGHPHHFTNPLLDNVLILFTIPPPQPHFSSFWSHILAFSRMATPGHRKLPFNLAPVFIFFQLRRKSHPMSLSFGFLRYLPVSLTCTAPPNLVRCSPTCI